MIDQSFAKKLVTLWFVFMGECESDKSEWYGVEPTFNTFVEWLDKELECT